MTPEIRAELLQQHDLLRTKLEQSRRFATEGSLRELHASLIDVGNVLRMHHLREEELLQDLLAALDDWGMTRVVAMVEEHADEHRQLYETLRVVSTTSDVKSATLGAIELVDRILAHMAEETLFLGPGEK